ncbi:hypothetical protein KDH_27640 [Dictyobacter sp. S3.2.2.5]|uniref:Uncharacterized protein n=1 Tax=Dictyobacter halimunensis TaxID=3026934 RepID=A0ABQ6FQG1_9CHLR|nr:hypothetical protein KDH_27640 [Dictyobacter sp. S3.2.2.5]
MTTNHHTPADIAAGLSTYHRGFDPTTCLCAEPTTLLIFTFDDTYVDAHPDEADVSMLMLPNPIRSLIWPIAEGDILTLSKQYDTTQHHTRPRPALVYQQCRVTSIHKRLTHDTQQFCLNLTITLLPLHPLPLPLTPPPTDIIYS